MLVYTKIVDGVRKLYGTMGKVHSDEDEELVYIDRDIETEVEEIVEPVEKDKYFAAPGYNVQRASTEKAKYFDVYIVDKDNDDELVNIIPGGREAPSLKEVTKIELNTENVKKDYNLNDKLDLTGIVVTATLKDPETGDEELRVISKGYESIPENGKVLVEEGEVTVVISYKLKTAEFEVNVVDPNKVKVYFGLSDSVPASLDSLEYEEINKDTLINMSDLAKSCTPVDLYVYIAVPKDIVTILHVYINDDRSMDNWSTFDQIDNDKYLFACTSDKQVSEEEMTLHFMLAPAN